MSASAIVKVTLQVVLTQPWSDEEKVGQVIKAATHEAKQAIARLINGHSQIQMVSEPVVKVIYEEGR